MWGLEHKFEGSAMEATGYWVAGAVVGISVLLLVLRSYNGLVYGGRKRLPPGSLGWPLIGESAELFKDFGVGGKPNEFMKRRFAKFGKLTAFKSHLFGKPTVILPSFEGIKFVLGSRELFKLGVVKPAEIIGAENFALFEGAKRKRFAEILMDSLAGPEALKNVIPVMDRQTKRLLEEAASKESFDMFELGKALVQSSEMEIFFGPSDQAAFDLFAEGFHKFIKGIFGYAVNLPGFSRYDAIQMRLKVQKWLQVRLEERRADGKEYSDCMSYLMNTVDENGEKLSDIVIVSTLFNFFTGSQSTYRPIFWMLRYLSKNPQFIPELREEHQKMAATKGPEEILSREDIRKLPFTKKVWDETLRLLNLFPFLFRVATTDVNFHGITIPKGWNALAWLSALHRDPEKFPEPEVFNPHRWDSPKTQAAPFLPFGHGLGHCPGVAQAQFQAALFIHNLIIKYDWEFKDLNAKVRYIPEARPLNCFAKLIPLKA